jgi:tetratricopeptide (TPR) repeat protein
MLWIAYSTLADIENRKEYGNLALNSCQERLKIYTIDRPVQYASCQKDLAVTYIMLANEEESDQEKAKNCKMAIDACNEALKTYTLSEFPDQYGEVQTLLWAGFTALAEVEERAKNCQKAIDACQRAQEAYAGRSLRECADVLKNLGYTYVTLAEVENRAENCKKAIEAYKSALEISTANCSHFEHAEIQRDLGYAYVILSDAEDKTENCKMAVKAYKKAFKAYLDASRELEEEGGLRAAEAKGNADECQAAMEACRKILKSSRRAKKVPS